MSFLSQINYYQTRIAELKQELDEKQMDLEQLERALSDLSNVQQEFSHNQHLCTEPELTSKTWHGQLGSNFDSIREGQILVSYQDLSNNQLSDAMGKVSSEIEKIKERIEYLKSEISSCESILSSLYIRQSQYLESLRK